MLKIPHHISNSFVREHPDWIFLYAHDYLGKGAFGQCVYFHGEPNTFAIPTMYKYCANPVYFNDSSEWFFRVDQTFKMIELIHESKIIIPCPKIGEGCSRMREFAPKLLEFIKQRLSTLQTPHEIDYGTQRPRQDAFWEKI